MLLYASTTSERASKGQGGKWLDIIIYNDKKQPAITIKAIADVTGRIRANIHVDMRYGVVDKNDSGFVINADSINTKSKHNPRTCENSVPCMDCLEVENPTEFKRQTEILKGKQKKDEKVYNNAGLCIKCNQRKINYSILNGIYKYHCANCGDITKYDIEN